jgi:spoIIIJ-associated protein
VSDVSEMTTDLDGDVAVGSGAAGAPGAGGDGVVGGGAGAEAVVGDGEGAGIAGQAAGAEVADGGEADAAASAAPSENALEEEGDIAADYIEELLDICDLDGDIDIDARAGRAYVSVNSSEDSNLRLLSQPDTVQALQELTRLAVQTKTGGFSRLILDVGGSRQIREAELAQLVTDAVDRIEVGGEFSVALAPMSSYERKVVHDIVAARGFSSNSEGEGRDRHTVIKQA